jgi:hypothetical protein
VIITDPQELLTPKPGDILKIGKRNYFEVEEYDTN